jgi:iron-sulfur cluster repair protein YtfE (RIC family)
MEHPFINNLSDKSLEELQTALSDLNTKLTFAHRTGNGPLIHQIQMVIESYHKESRKKMDELFSKQNIQTQVNIQREDQIGNKNRT